MTPINRQEIGNQAEQQAHLFLQAQGFSLIVQNYRSRYGEIDLIMRDRDDIVFIEVRSRSRLDYGHPAETINKRKQQKLIKTAIDFLQKKEWLYKVNCRFDVIAIHLEASQWQIEWFKNAFSTER
jgi:putative endonuclease